MKMGKTGGRRKPTQSDLYPTQTRRNATYVRLASDSNRKESGVKGFCAIDATPHAMLNSSPMNTPTTPLLTMRGITKTFPGLKEEKAAVAFSLYPTTIEDLLKVSDAGEIMPPKSTWFEPKLRDGLLSHEI